MDALPLVLAVPLCGAVVLVLLSHVRLPNLGNGIALALSTATTALCAYVLYLVVHRGMLLYWFGAWKPATHVGIGIDFAVDGIGAAGALLASFVVTLVMVYSTEYYEDSGPLFNVLLLVYQGAACACFYTGDLFDLFVFFELSNIATFSLTAYKVRDATALDGALVFVITNSVGAFALLFGLTLLEGYSDQLNLATIGQYLTVHPAQAVAVGSLALVACGFFLRSAVAPFHFWYPDAQSSAPSPVSAIFCAVTVEIGLYAFARTYWSVFSGAFHATIVLRASLVALGSASALLGAIMSFGAHHLKRMIAYVTIVDVGIQLMGIGFLNAHGLAASLLFSTPYALGAAALVLCSGAIVHRFGTGDELELWGAGRELPAAGITFLAASLAIIGLPVIGTFAGRAVLFGASSSIAPTWIVTLTIVSSSIAGGSLLKAFGSVWLGLGEPDPELTHARENDKDSSEDESDQPEKAEVGWHLLVPAALFAGASLAVPLIPQVWRAALAAAQSFVARRHYYAMTVYGHASPPAAPTPLHPDWVLSAACGGATLFLACALALASLYQRRLRRLHAAAVFLSNPMEWLEGLHEGRIGEYVTWFTLGSALLGGVFFIAYK